MQEIALHQLLSGIAATSEDANPFIHGVQTDSRNVGPGDVFLAYPGLNVDGRDYIPAALERGAAAILYDPADYLVALDTTIPLVPVAKLQQRASEIAARFYCNPANSMRLIGVTGTNGKTTVTQFIARTLSALRIRCAVMGTLGNGFVPDLRPTTHTTLDAIELQKNLALLRRQRAQAVALEVSSHALHQGRVRGTHFEVAVLTHLSRDHLDYHGNMQRYAQAKELLFQQSGLRYGIVNLDDALGRKIARQYHDQFKIIGYASQSHAFSHLDKVLATNIAASRRGFTVDIVTPWGSGQFTTPLLGRFNVSNLLAVIAVLGTFDIALVDIMATVAQLATIKGRMQRYGNQRQPQVIVDYAHTPDALQKVLLALREHCQGELYCVFGCGGERDRGKRPQMAAIAERHADHVIMTSDNPRNEPPEKIIADMRAGLRRVQAAKIELNRAAAIHHAVHAATINDMVLVAGKGHETTQTVAEKVIPLDDGEIVQQALAHYNNKE